jgi:hypothetical protein
MPRSERWKIKLFVLAFIAIALPIFTNEVLGNPSDHENGAWYWQILNRHFWYRQFAPGGPNKTRIDEIKIVSIVRNVEPGSVLGENRCSHRAFMARLLQKLAKANPRLIVIDKWYGRIPPGVCSAHDDGTAPLKKAVQSVSSQVPVIIAAASYNAGDVQQICPALMTDALKPGELVLAEYEKLDATAPPGRVSYGLARVNRDNRKIPLGWLVFGECSQVGHQRPELWPTLSMAAATTLDPNIMGEHDLAQLQRDVTHPYTKLMPEGTFEYVSAIRLVCNEAAVNVDWTRCADNEGDGKALAALAHKVVIVGETWNDLQITDVGTMTGATLQANYIASLLDESILRPVPRSLDYATSAFWLVVIFWIFYGWKPEFPELAAVVSLFVTFVLGVGFTSVIAKQWGIFADVVPPTLLEIIGLYLARRTEMLSSSKV